MRQHLCIQYTFLIKKNGHINTQKLDVCETTKFVN